MQIFVLAGAIFILATVAFFLGRQRAMAMSAGGGRRLHSLPSYYGYYAALWSALPALALMLVWALAQGHVVEALTLKSLPDAGLSLPQAKMSLIMTDIRNTAAGAPTAAAESPEIAAAAGRYQALNRGGFWALAVLCLGIGGAGLFAAMRRIRPPLRARNLG